MYERQGSVGHDRKRLRRSRLRIQRPDTDETRAGELWVRRVGEGAAGWLAGADARWYRLPPALPGRQGLGCAGLGFWHLGAGIGSKQSKRHRRMGQAAVTEGGGPEVEDREKKCVGAKAYPMVQVTLPCSLLDPHLVGNNPRPKF